MKKYNIVKRKDEAGEVFYTITKWFFFPIRVTTLGSYTIPCFPNKALAEQFLGKHLCH